MFKLLKKFFKKEKKIAIFIDAENMTHQKVEKAINLIKNHGKIVLISNYGSLYGKKTIEFYKQLAKHSCYKNVETPKLSNKNSADFYLTIDVMDFLHKNNPDIICIISSDSDYAALIKRIKQEKIEVWGFGTTVINKQYTLLCDNFFFFDRKSIDNIKEEINFLAKNWISSNKLNTELRKLHPNFSLRDYGYSKFKSLYKDIPNLETKIISTTTYIRQKSNPSKILV